MKTLDERISFLLEEVGSSVTILANIAGVKPPSVSDWVNGKTKSLRSAPVIRIARHFGVNFLWLTEGVGPMKNGESEKSPEVLPGNGWLPVRRALFKLSAGVSGYEIEYENGESRPIYMDKSWFEQRGYRPEKLIAVKVSGRSMEPSLHEGDLVVINTEDTAPKDGEVFAANFEGELVIKRMKREAGNWFLSSDNQDKIRFGDKVCSEGCGLIGRIVYKQSEHI